MSLQHELERLRAAGAAQRDPLRFGFAEGLARRLDGAPDAVRPALEQKLHAALDALQERLQAAPAPASADEPARVEAQDPLAGLNLHIRAATGGTTATPAGAPAAALPGLRNARRFRQAWGRQLANETLEQAIHHGPREAGPLNSHRLVLQTLQLMQALSPDYLQRFLARADALLWLERQRPR